MARVVVSGSGFVTSIGNNAGEVTESLRALRHGICEYLPFADPRVPVKVAAPIRGFITDGEDPEDWSYPDRYRIRRDVIRSMAPHAVYAYCAMQQAIESARLSPDDISSEETGIYTGGAGSPALLHHHMNRMHTRGIRQCSPVGVVASIAGTLNFNLAAAFKIQGASTGFVSACASSGHALGHAYDEIKLGRQKRMFVVGAEDGNYGSILPFASMRALSSATDPDRASRPFDKDRDGFVGTGGGVVLLLEDERSARARGIAPTVEMIGWGQASDGHNVALSHPNGDGLVRAMRRALASASLTPQDVGYVNAHAPSTAAGDLSEIRALERVFADCRPRISSTKALTGHGLSLASIMEAGFCVRAIEEGFTPGSANIDVIDPEAAGLNIIRKTEDREPGVVLSNSSGFGGGNVCVAFRKIV